MTKEYKELLLKDISARLPYGVKTKTPYNDAIIVGIVNRKGARKDIDYTDVVTDKQTYPIKYIKPYLRPMSSMTEEEREEYQEFIFPCPNYDGKVTIGVYHRNLYKVQDWLNFHHFDYKGLIEKGLAIEVTDENNPYK